MSEQNILNPTATSAFNPDYGAPVQDASGMGIFRPLSGTPITRLLQARGRMFQMQWTKRTLANKRALLQWERQYRNDFFTYYDIEHGRYFSGKFTGPLQFSQKKNETWDLSGEFEEEQGRVLYQYPGEASLLTTATAWLTDGFFIEERDSSGNDLAKMSAGNWTTTINANCHGGKAYYSNILDATAEWLYFGYGLRVWSEKQPAFGKVEISLDGTVVSAALDLYNVANLASAPVFQKTDVTLGIHRVKLRCTHTKNASASDYYVSADAIEVMA